MQQPAIQQQEWTNSFVTTQSVSRRKALSKNVHHQKTLSKSVTFTDIGVHGGLPVTMTVKPAPIDHGFVFVRTDLPGSPAIKACWSTVSDTSMSTRISNDSGDAVNTVEHIMAALAGLGIQNALIEIDGPEVPIMDGSSVAFVSEMAKAGVYTQHARTKTLRILKPVHVSHGENSVTLLPASEPRFSMEYDMNKRLPRTLTFSFYPDSESFAKVISPARTFGLYEDAQRLWAAGLAKGASLENTIVIGESGVMNEGGLRFDDELVRHKVLDAIGDLHLSGYRILGHFHGVNAGHALNNKLLRALFADPSAWSLEEANENVLY